MNCNNCGAQVKDDDKFCTECGNKIEKLSSDFITCTNCGKENQPSNKFCENCGNSLSRAKNDDKHEQRNRKPVNSKSSKTSPHNRNKRKVNSKKLNFIDIIEQNKTVTVLILFIIGFGVLQIFKTEEIPQRNTFLNRQNATPTGGIGATRVDILASKFICSCGTCGELPLESCNCPTAVEEKNFIQQKINEKLSDNEIIAAVNAKFGWIKPQFAYLLSAADQNADKGNKNDGELIVPSGKIATIVDRDYIIGQFKCACGQCGIDELLECNCNHIRGAKEVKAFIDKKIAEKKFTPEEIINIVNQVYGGLKV